jgi:hypothetical protein
MIRERVIVDVIDAYFTSPHFTHHFSPDFLSISNLMSLKAETLRRSVQEQSALLDTLSQSEARLRDMFADVSREKELLSRDKAYLQKELNDAILKG